jgi:hypothetical protein
MAHAFNHCLSPEDFTLLLNAIPVLSKRGAFHLSEYNQIAPLHARMMETAQTHRSLFKFADTQTKKGDEVSQGFVQLLPDKQTKVETSEGAGGISPSSSASSYSDASESDSEGTDSGSGSESDSEDDGGHGHVSWEKEERQPKLVEEVAPQQQKGEEERRTEEKNTTASSKERHRTRSILKTPPSHEPDEPPGAPLKPKPRRRRHSHHADAL